MIEIVHYATKPFPCEANFERFLEKKNATHSPFRPYSLPQQGR